MKNLKLWDQILLITEKVNEYVENNHHKLAWDEIRSLKWNQDWEETYHYYFVCEFNDWTSLINETINSLVVEKDDEDDNTYIWALIVPTEIFKKSDNQRKPDYTIEIPVKWIIPDENWIYDKEEYINTSRNRTKKLLEEIEEINKKRDNIVNTINNIVIANALNKEIPIWQEIRLEYEIDLISILTKYSFISLFAYVFDENKETLIKKDDNHYSWIFDSKMTINKIIKNTMFVIRNKNRQQDEYTLDWYILTNCDLKLGFNKNEKDELLFIIKFKKTNELLSQIEE